jgi:hypothetical protein
LLTDREINKNGEMGNTFPLVNKSRNETVPLSSGNSASDTLVVGGGGTKSDLNSDEESMAPKCYTSYNSMDS